MRSSKLNDVQERLLKILSKHVEAPLSYRDLAEEVGVSSTNTISYHLQQLEQKGHLKRDPGDPRHYVVLGQPETGIAYLNIYGLAQCGPRGSILDGEPVDRMPISTKLIPCPASEAFLLKARGDSMEPRIFEGDLLLCRRQKSAEDGQIVACVNDGEALIKRLKLGDRPLLLSLNPKYDPFVAAKDFRVEGVVRTIVSRAMA